MSTYTGEMDILDLQPYRLPTDILAEIDDLSRERRTLLTEISSSPLDPKLKARLTEIDGRLEELWLARRMELRRTI
ncbi:MAG: hypothetical protein EA415_03910 [Sphaerobacteraceae bacterium]|nr:MAG: hypothetical protein EA415_03910 [Sphaerobacteraceae bacterium]